MERYNVVAKKPTYAVRRLLYRIREQDPGATQRVFLTHYRSSKQWSPIIVHERLGVPLRARIGMTTSPEEAQLLDCERVRRTGVPISVERGACAGYNNLLYLPYLLAYLCLHPFPAHCIEQQHGRNSAVRATRTFNTRNADIIRMYSRHRRRQSLHKSTARGITCRRFNAARSRVIILSNKRYLPKVAFIYRITSVGLNLL
jgi:hypothetical protein